MRALIQRVTHAAVEVDGREIGGIGPGLLVLDAKPGNSGITCIISTQLDDDDLEELQESQQFLEVHMRKWREERAKRKEAEATSVAEIRRLAAIGKKVEEHNLLNKLRELEEKLAAKGG